MFKHGFPPEWSTFKKLIWLVGSGIAGAASGIWKTVTGTLIHITDALPSPVRELSVAIEPLQSGSGDPSPDNVRPITGWTGCNIYIRNANLLDYSKETVNYRLDNVGKLTSNSNYATSEFISVKPDKWYYFRSLVTSSVGYAIAEYTDKDPNTFIRIQQVGSGLSPKSTARQTSQTTNYIRVSYWKNHSDDPAVLYPSGNTEYVPYAGTTLSVTFPDGQTVYGGKYDFISGGLKPYKEYESYNGETLTGEWMSSIDKYVSGTTPTIGAQVVDLDAYDATVQLTPQEITTLAGENNVWADVNGEITLTYQAVPQTAFSDEADKGMADYMTLTE